MCGRPTNDPHISDTVIIRVQILHHVNIKIAKPAYEVSPRGPPVEIGWIAWGAHLTTSA